jgi:hypothetical protein
MHLVRVDHGFDGECVVGDRAAVRPVPMGPHER